MAPLAETFSDLAEEDDLNQLTPSEEVYFEFRQTIEPGFFDANFDLTPAKSSANQDRRTGEPFVDQSLRNHILNGAAFGSRFNRALSELGFEAALSPEDLKIALALHAVHDAHKTEKAQKRRQISWKEAKRKDADKDISDSELRVLLDELRLTSFVGLEDEDHDADVEISFKTYLTAALATEKSSGRHNSLFSRQFARKYRAWVRLMDAAGGLSSPTDIDGLRERINTISDGVQVHFHHLKDIKGITTNLLTKTLADRARSTGAEPIVFFEDGALYLSEQGSPGGTELFFKEEGKIDSEFYTEYVETLTESNPSLGQVEGVRDSLNKTNWPRGYLGITETSFFFADSVAKTSDEDSSAVAVAIDAVRSEIEARSERDPNRYSIYETALKHAVEVGLIETLPPTYQKPQLLGAFIGTLFRNLLWHDDGLCGKGNESYEQAIEDFAEMLGVPEAGRMYDISDTSSPQIAEDTLSELAETLDKPKKELRDELHDGISPNKQNRVESVFLGIAYLYRNGGYDQRSLPTLLREVQEAFIDRYDEWPDHWAENLSYWDTDRPVEEKQDDFTERRTGNFSEAFPRYVSRYLTVDGEQFAIELNDPTFDEYLNPKYGSAQPRMCLLCREELLGDSTSFSDYKTNSDEVGRSLTFTHLRKLAPSSGEAKSIICPICQFELNLRNAAHQTDTDNDSAYLFLVPDYFHSPVDLAIANRVNSLLNSSVGSFIDLARQIITSDVSSRSEAAELFLDVFKSDESEDFQRTIQNYDSSYADANMLGLFRIDVPTRPGGDDLVNPTTFWTLARYIVHVLSWGTGSRVLLSDSPFPSTSFDEFDQMVATEGLPAPVERHLPSKSTISSRSDLGAIPEEITIRQPQAGDSSDSDHSDENAAVEKTTADQQSTVTKIGDDEQPLRANSSEQTTLTNIPGSEPAEENTTSSYDETVAPDDVKSDEDGGTPTQATLSLRTDFGVELYRQSALFYVTQLSHDYDVQRVTTLLDALTDPFAGSSSILKGNETSETYSAQFGALVLDSTTHPIMSNTLQTLADHGFEVLSPESPSKASTYDYERLFRVGCDTLSDGFAERATREMMIQTVAGEVAKAGSRINQNRENTYAPSEGQLSDEAVAFGEVFVDDIFLDICNGDYYQLRRLQNRLASGFNLAMRETQREFFDSLESKSQDSDSNDSDVVDHTDTPN